MLFQEAMLKEVNGLRNMIFNLENNQNKKQKISWWDEKTTEVQEKGTHI